MAKEAAAELIAGFLSLIIHRQSALFA